VLAALAAMQAAQAVPSFARQTGQSCVACHAGGQFPELTPYGRLFKLTGYTQGERGNPLAGMVVASMTRTRNNSDGAGGGISPFNNQAVLDFGSLFLAGKIGDKLGGFAQFTSVVHDHQDGDGHWQSHFGSDNFDLRYADRKINAEDDLIWGVTLNNNPSVQDVWNSSPAWGYPYLSSSLGAFGAVPVATLIEGGLAQQVAGVGAYVYWNRALYAEWSSYQTAKGLGSLLSLGNQPGDANHPLSSLDGSGQYWRLAYTREWAAHNAMLGAFGLDAKVFPLDANFSTINKLGSTRYQDLGLDAQYQYLLAPHTVTTFVRLVRERISDATGLAYTGAASLHSLKAKGSYVYQARYGVSLAYTRVNGSADAMAYASAANSPNTVMWTPEIFWMPLQSLRIGLQYNRFTRYLGAANNYDGSGRHASDNDTAFLYAWWAF